MLHYQLGEIWKRIENKLLFQPFGVLGCPGVGIRGRPVPATVPIVGGMPGGVSLWRSADRGVGLWYRGRRISGVEKKCSFPFFSKHGGYGQGWLRYRSARKSRLWYRYPKTNTNRWAWRGFWDLPGGQYLGAGKEWKRMEKNSSFPGVGVSGVVGSQKLACNSRGWS